MRLRVVSRVFSFAIAALFVLSRALAAQELSNWKAPLLWSFTKAGKEADQSVDPLAVEAVPTALLPFVGIPPCRVADTRGNGFTGQYGPPAVTGAGRTMAITGQCGIPAAAQAVSFNFTAANVSASGFLVAYPAGGAFPPVATMAYNQNTPNISNAAVVPLGTGGAITIVAGVTTVDVIVDANGYYGPDLDSICVNEGQASSVTSSMIVDGTIINADISASAAIADTKLATIATAGKVADSALSSNVSLLGPGISSSEITDGTIVDADVSPSAAIADTKLATISTAGKVADSALSSNVTKLGPTIEASEITNITRELPIPLTSFVKCDGGTGALLDFSSSATDRIPDFTIFAARGLAIQFDADAGFEDQDSEICAQFPIPRDYASGGAFRVRYSRLIPDTGAVESLVCVGR
ncbi:MAG TPA: hypothetical protein VIY96_07550, partial [Thermoanaerobaculia bacterium]